MCILEAITFMTSAFGKRTRFAQLAQPYNQFVRVSCFPCESQSAPKKLLAVPSLYRGWIFEVTEIIDKKTLQAMKSPKQNDTASPPFGSARIDSSCLCRRRNVPVTCFTAKYINIPHFELWMRSDAKLTLIIFFAYHFGIVRAGPLEWAHSERCGFFARPFLAQAIYASDMRC